MKRRTLIKSIAGLAALTVMPGEALAGFALDGIAEQFKGGVIQGQVFYIDREIILSVPDTTITHCSFIATAPMEFMITMESERTALISNTIDCKHISNGIHVLPPLDKKRVWSNRVVNAKLGLRYTS